MKKHVGITLVLAASLVLIGGGCKQGAEKKTTDTPSKASKEMTEKKRYEVKSGHVEYTYDGMKTGTESMYFDDWGWKESATSNTVFSIGGVKENSFRLLDGIKQYQVNLDTNTGTEIENVILKELMDNAQGDSLTALGEQMLEQMGGEKTGSKTVAGHECDIWEIASLGTTQCIYKGVLLELNSNLGGINFSQTATSVEFDIDVDASKLELPEGVEITESIDLDDLMKNL